ncbi:MAG: acylneuraminate cytidylyltransferase family protein, partial [Acidimicrobiales bacterium]|nr:acylneuraminate cytidylyltransferase family protein [Acidimicrobiales bacterium]
MSSTIALIGARSGSKGVPDKNIRMLGGMPLLAWSIAAAKKATSIDQVIVSTNSAEYAEIATVHGAEVPFLRP